MKEFEVWGEHITLGQLLKVAGVVDSGGEVRYYLAGRPV
ncbi:MAG: RNA-binding S4 domain-containing protein, partial [Chloroflexi bacterium]|nr:RNA-binding S4 domain-containing protein [Chloroflexota bacterium]